MPPKAKTIAKEKKKVVEDKTFGMKNKNKSAKAQKYIQQLESQVMGGSVKAKRAEVDAKAAAAEKKKQDEARKTELLELFKPVAAQQKVPFGVDPKTLLCAFFKLGQCQKGDKCKFSHDPNVERKAMKMDIYTDARDREEEEKANDTMDKWDQTKLEQVVDKKHGKGTAPNRTDIVCKYFLEAIENRKYGWFWECPNGGKNCQYRHALPPGFVLKSERKLEDKEEISLEEFIESERHKLGSNLTPVNLDSFTKWKEGRLAKRKADEEEARKKKEEAYKAGRGQGLSGRDMFTFNPDLMNMDDDEAMDDSAYQRQEGAGDDDEQDQQGTGYLGNDDDDDEDGPSGPSGVTAENIEESLYEDDVPDVDNDDDDDENDEDDDDDDDDGEGPSA